MVASDPVDVAEQPTDADSTLTKGKDKDVPKAGEETAGKEESEKTDKMEKSGKGDA